MVKRSATATGASSASKKARNSRDRTVASRAQERLRDTFRMLDAEECDTIIDETTKRTLRQQLEYEMEQADRG